MARVFAPFGSSPLWGPCRRPGPPSVARSGGSWSPGLPEERGVPTPVWGGRVWGAHLFPPRWDSRFCNPNRNETQRKEKRKQRKEEEKKNWCRSFSSLDRVLSFASPSYVGLTPCNKVNGVDCMTEWTLSLRLLRRLPPTSFGTGAMDPTPTRDPEWPTYRDPFRSLGIQETFYLYYKLSFTKILKTPNEKLFAPSLKTGREERRVSVTTKC